MVINTSGYTSIWAIIKVFSIKTFQKFGGPVPSQNYRHKKMKPRVFHHKDAKVSFLFWVLGCFQFVAGRQISVPLAAFGFRVPGHKSAGRFCRGFV